MKFEQPFVGLQGINNRYEGFYSIVSCTALSMFFLTIQDKKTKKSYSRIL